MKKVKIKINNKEIFCEQDSTIMQVSRDNGIDLPSLCFHPDFSAKANCRVCVVEIVGRKNLAASCSTKVENGMEIMTNTKRVKKARNLNIELIFAEHIEKCPTCIWRVNCRLLNLANKYKIKITRFKDRKKTRKIYKFANAVEIDGAQCIDCRNCLDACSIMQKINYLELKGKGVDQEIVPTTEKNKKVDCIYCGQCAVHCPVGAAQEQSHWEMTEEALNDKNKIVAAQFDHFSLVSIGEEFNLPYGKISIGQITAGLRQLGFDYIFDVNMGAHITVAEEAMELAKRLKKNKSKRVISDFPVLASYCPAFVKYIEFFHPKFIPNLTNVQSPHINNGSVIKSYLAEQLKIDPKKIIVASIMPCTAKKFEASRLELKINNNRPVDYVLTVRELAWMFKKNRIEINKLKNSFTNNLFKKHSKASAIYGENGGVISSVLRIAQDLFRVSKKTNSRFHLDFKKARDLSGVKSAKIKIAGKILRAAVVNGIGNIKPILDKASDYDYIEVMACPDGCVGGGGQPFSIADDIRKKRLNALYKIKNC